MSENPEKHLFLTFFGPKAVYFLEKIMGFIVATPCASK